MIKKILGIQKGAKISKNEKNLKNARNQKINFRKKRKKSNAHQQKINPAENFV